MVPEVTGLSVTVGVVTKAAGHAQRCVDLSRMDGLSCMQRLPLDDLSRTAHAVSRADTATECVPVALRTERSPQRERESVGEHIQRHDTNKCNDDCPLYSEIKENAEKSAAFNCVLYSLSLFPSDRPTVTCC